MTIRGILVMALHLVFLFSFLLLAWHFYVSDFPVLKIDIMNPHCCEVYQKLSRSCVLWQDFIFFLVLSLHIVLLLHGSFSCCFRCETNVPRCLFVREKLWHQLFQAIKLINGTGNLNSGFIGTMLERNISKYTNLI